MNELNRDYLEYLDALSYPLLEIKDEGGGYWLELKQKALECSACKLSSCGRTQVVFGAGDPQARLFFVGEAPGAEEDLQGLPFVGASGQLLTKMIQAMGLSREKVYIANGVKCRPPGNRNPEADEIAACSHWLQKQIAYVNPEIIVCLGTFAGQQILGSEKSISQLRGQFYEYKINGALQKRKEGSPIWVMPTYHPAFCLRNSEMKKPVWEDLKKVRDKLGASPAF